MHFSCIFASHSVFLVFLSLTYSLNRFIHLDGRHILQSFTPDSFWLTCWRFLGALCTFTVCSVMKETYWVQKLNSWYEKYLNIHRLWIFQWGIGCGCRMCASLEESLGVSDCQMKLVTKTIFLFLIFLRFTSLFCCKIGVFSLFNLFLLFFFLYYYVQIDFLSSSCQAYASESVAAFSL